MITPIILIPPWLLNWRWASGTANTPTDLYATNTATTSASVGDRFRLRVQVAERGGQGQTDAKKKLQFATSSPDLATTTWTDVGENASTTAAWRYWDGPGAADDSATTSSYVISGSTQPGPLVENGSAASVFDQTASVITEFDFAIENYDTSASTTYYFRLYDNDQQTLVFRQQTATPTAPCNNATCTYPTLNTAGAPTITVSGKVYSDEGQTALGGGRNVRIKVNGAGAYSTTTDVNSNYSIPGVIINAAGDTLTVFLDEGAFTEKAVAVTRASSTTANITGLNLYQNRIIARHEGASFLTISDLDKYDWFQDPDILFTASSTGGTLTATSTSEFFVWAGDTFGSWGTAGAGATTSLANLDIRGTFTATSSQIIQVSRNWDATTTAVFNSASSTVEFTSTVATTTIRTNGQAFWNLTFNGSGGVWTFQDAATTTGDLTITDGTASSTYNMFVLGGGVTGNGTLNWTGGTFTVAGSGGFSQNTPWNFYHLTFGTGSSGDTTLLGFVNATVTVSGNFTVASGHTLNGPKSFTIQGGNATGNGVISLTNGTFLLDGLGNFGGTSGWNFKNLTFGDGAGAASTTAGSSGTTTVSGVLTIAPNQQLYAGTKPWVLSGAGTPFVINGEFYSATSTFKYTVDGFATVTAAIYYNLKLGQDVSLGGHPTWIIQGGTLAANNYLTIGNGIDGLTVTADANDPVLDILGNFTINSNATFTASQTAGFSISGAWINEGSFVHSSSTVVFDGSSGGYSIFTYGTSTGKTFYNIDFNGSGASWTVSTYNLLAENNFSITTGLFSTDRTVEVRGIFTNSAGGASTSWAGSTLYLNKSGGGGYTINTKTTGGDGYGILQIGANNDIRMWDSSVATATVDSTGSLYSMDTGGISGYLDIWGDYHTTSTDWCSYNTDFDGADISGFPRQCLTYIYSGASWTVDSGAALDVKGGGLDWDFDRSVLDYGEASPFLWNFSCLGTCNIQESFWNYPRFASGTTTLLNTHLYNESVTSTAVLNVDWYLGVHIVDKDETTHNIDTGDNDITASSSAATIWKWSGSAWQGPYNSTTTGTQADGKIPPPDSVTAGAIRLREYQRTVSATTTYKYNLAIVSQPGFLAYNYYQGQGNNYLTSTSSVESANVDKVIYERWHRITNSSMNTPYSAVNDPPQNGSWYIGMSSDLQCSVNSSSVNLGTLSDINSWTATNTTVLSATTSYTAGYNIKAYASNNGRLRLGVSSNYIERWPYANSTPALWDVNCPANSSYCGFGYTTGDTSLYNASTSSYDNRFADSTKFAGFATSSPGDRLADSTGAASGATTTITYKASASSTYAAGDYSATIYYICTANY